MSIVVKKQKKHVYHKGDFVKIKRPLFVVRVGYPWTKNYIRDNFITEEHKQAIYDMLKTFGVTTVTTQYWWCDTLFNKVLNVMSGVLLRQHGFGGTERRIHTIEMAEFQNETAKIIGKRVVQTGDYHEASSSQDSWTGEIDYEPAFLMNRETHVLLRILGCSVDLSQLPTSNLLNLPEIEECNVEPWQEEKLPF